MKILAVADLHHREVKIQQVIAAAQAHQPDLIIVCGDITHFGTAEEAQATLERLPGTILAIPGNCDPPSVQRGIKHSRASDLTGSQCTVEGLVIAGPGAEVDTCDIFVVHEPPRGFLDMTNIGRHIGRTDVAYMVEQLKPRVVLCGHVHESPGIAPMNDHTTVVNCSIGGMGRGAIVEINASGIRAYQL